GARTSASTRRSSSASIPPSNAARAFTSCSPACGKPRSMNQSPLRRAASAIRTASRILIACHVRPDGDALGSLLALGLGCMALGKRVVMVSPDGVPDAYRFLPLWECVATAAEGEFDLGIGVDADGSARLGSAQAAVLAAPQVIDLDHHI